MACYTYVVVDALAVKKNRIYSNAKERLVDTIIVLQFSKLEYTWKQPLKGYHKTWNAIVFTSRQQGPRVRNGKFGITYFYKKV